MQDLHSALRATELAETSAEGIHYKLVRLQNNKDSFLDTIHANPNTFFSSGFQTTDFLNIIGFKRSACAFHRGECYCKALSSGVDIGETAKAISASYERFKKGESHLAECGIFIDQPEGVGFFAGRPSSSRTYSSSFTRGDGHVAPKVGRMKESEDEFFRFIFTFIEGGEDKGWTTHYRAKHMPLSNEFQSVIEFLGDFKWFVECPEFKFEGCFWRFAEFEKTGDGFLHSNVESAHRYFDSHSANFSLGVQALLNAHAMIEPFGLSFLKTNIAKTSQHKPSIGASKSSTEDKIANKSGFPYDVAFSFAGTERPQAEELARLARNAGLVVFYDNFYPEQLWGKNLVDHFDRIYRKESRFCVMFLSREYAERMWTSHERRSATARALQEKGNEYILPIKVDDIDIDGMPPTIGYVSLKERSISEIADLLIQKVNSKNEYQVTTASIGSQSVTVHEKWVNLNYPSDSGIQNKLEKSGFKVRWCLDKNVASRTEMEGWEVVIEPDKNGILYRFRIKDFPDNQTLIKKKL